MKSVLRLTPYIASLLVVLGLSVSGLAQAQVKASLVAADASVQPGKSTTVALRLEHEAHWHTYWINAGTGYPSKITWELPAGWKAGEIQWPVPHKIKGPDGTLTGHGYENVAYLPVSITAPTTAATGSEVTLKGKAEWLMCAEICIPGEADVSLTLPVTAAAPKPNAAVRAELNKQAMPTAARDLDITAARNGKVI